MAGLTLPEGALLVSGDNPANVGNMSDVDTKNVSWTVVFPEAGTFSINVNVSGKYNGSTPVETHRTVDINVFPRQEHDLAVLLETSAFLEPNTSLLLNATIYNVGLNRETDVELRLLINGTFTDSAKFSLSAGESQTLSYPWTPTVEATYNVTTYALPVPNEENTTYNVYSTDVKVHFAFGHVAVLNSWESPSYFRGGLSNDHELLVDALNARGFIARSVTNEDVVGGILNLADVFVMVDNVPSDTAVSWVVDFWSNGGGIIAFDSSICFLCYAGILPSESLGSNGYQVYWDYETKSVAKISKNHPITKGFEIDQTISGTSGDAEYRVEALSETSAYSDYAFLVENTERPDRAYVSAYQPSTVGKVVHIWDAKHWGSTQLQTMILNAIEWAVSGPAEHDIAVAVTPYRTIIAENCCTNITVTVKNQGDFTETVNMTVFANSNMIETRALILSRGESFSLVLDWNTTGTAKGDCTLLATSSTVQNETITENNNATCCVQISIKGDINGDGKVNILDMARAAKAFDSYLGHSRWYADADVNEDEKIDKVDISVIAEEFGSQSF